MDRDDKIIDYVQNRLSPSERERFEQSMARDTSLAAEVGLMQSVRTELATGPRHKNADAVWDRLSSAIDPAPETANDNRRPWREALKYAAVAAVAVGIWQFTVMPRTTNQPGGFTTASEQSNRPTLQIRFVDTTTIADITALLGLLGGTITSGPSALGLVHVAFPDASAQQRALETLSARSDLIELVQEQ